MKATWIYYLKNLKIKTMSKQQKIEELRKALNPNPAPIAPTLHFSDGSILYGQELFKSLADFKARYPNAANPQIKFEHHEH